MHTLRPLSQLPCTDDPTLNDEAAKEDESLLPAVRGSSQEEAGEWAGILGGRINDELRGGGA